MPFATFLRVREVSSEDSQFVAENLIRPQGGKKWKTQKPGEKSAYVIMEMEEAKIVGIDIGNEHSAFVEVLVGKNAVDFEEILITCSFMTPIESRNSDNANRVRCFSEDALVASVAQKKWSMMKIVCTQPFNRHVQYGLSFIKVHVAPSNTPKPVATVVTKIQQTSASKLGPSNSIQFGKFKLREESPDSENEGASNLFNKWKNRRNIDEQSTAAASRNSMNTSIKHDRVVINRKDSHGTKVNSECKQTEVRDRNRNTLLFGEPDDIPTEKELRLEKEIEADKEKLRKEKLCKENKQKAKENVGDHNKVEVRAAQNVATEQIVPSAAGSTINSKEIERVRTLEHERRKKRAISISPRRSKKVKAVDTEFRPFNRLLNGVVLVISGIQNPDRSALRNKALALGAKYKGDWDDTCTHLICAFKNTPKYNQVKGKGKIVSRSWIEKCFDLKKYLPWRRYALDSEELTKPESDEEILDESFKPEENVERETDDTKSTLALYDLDDDKHTVSGKKLCVSSSETDTDDEIQRIKQIFFIFFQRIQKLIRTTRRRMVRRMFMMYPLMKKFM
ncbi:DNA repair protein XRCC1 isoform X2 [Haematobia irritans]|uniref:DNA repair protein XRCC1 isoform X2 n=1 Tax=Haematobia irritans TaxID=7368 RepID=UPI003F50AFA2